MDIELDKAVRAAMLDAAERAILPRFSVGTPLAGTYKSPGEVVTAADRESEAILAEHLQRIIPGIPVVGEEAVHDQPDLHTELAAPACWIVDPLDGTGNFAAGQTPFGILVALANEGIPVGGWILDPHTGRFCAAQAGRGASVDLEPFKRARSSGERSVVAVTRLFRDADQRQAIVAALSPSYEVIDAPRCAADLYPQLATAQLEAAVFTRTLSWDHAAGVLFLNESGGYVARPDGEPYRCQDPATGLIAANSQEQWDRIVFALQKSETRLGSVNLPGG